MHLTIFQLDESNYEDLNLVDNTFTVEGKLYPHTDGAEIGYTVVPGGEGTKTIPPEVLDYTVYTGDPAKVIYFAYMDEHIAGQIILEKWWNRFCYVRDLAVDVHFRRQGVGRRLMDEAVRWAKAGNLPGIMLETQNNNLEACRFYESYGFHLGGFDRHLYQGLHPQTDQIALFWYLIF